MAYIKQKTEGIVTILNIGDYQGNLAQHPTLTGYPQYFELINEELPDDYQYVNFVPPIG